MQILKTRNAGEGTATARRNNNNNNSHDCSCPPNHKEQLKHQHLIVLQSSSRRTAIRYCSSTRTLLLLPLAVAVYALVRQSSFLVASVFLSKTTTTTTNLLNEEESSSIPSTKTIVSNATSPEDGSQQPANDDALPHRLKNPSQGKISTAKERKTSNTTSNPERTEKKNNKKSSKSTAAGASSTKELEHEQQQREEPSGENNRKKNAEGSRHHDPSSSIISNIDVSQQRRQKPEIVWLASYPNSGTSYTMTLVERASNLSTASHYGVEVTPPKRPSLPLHQHLTINATSQADDIDIGPYWEGLEGAALMKHTVRELPSDYVLTKTHCGGRCLRCGPDEYADISPRAFLDGCLRTTGYYYSNISASATSIDRRLLKLEQGKINPARVSKLVHLIRSPFDNVVARFHLDNRHLKRKDSGLGYPNNATGFVEWCKSLERDVGDSVWSARTRTARIRTLVDQINCGAEFYKYAQWHSKLHEIVPRLGGPPTDSSTDRATSERIPVLYLYYEDFEKEFNSTVSRLMDFVQQDVVARRLRPFRALPDYSDHYSADQRKLIQDLVREVSSSEAYELIRLRYLSS